MLIYLMETPLLCRLFASLCSSSLAFGLVFCPEDSNEKGGQKAAFFMHKTICLPPGIEDLPFTQAQQIV